METSAETFARRRQALKERLRQERLSGLLVSHAANRWYLSGFELMDSQCNESAGWLLITADGEDHLLTDPRFEEAARRVWPENIVIYTARKMDRIGVFLESLSLQRLGFEPKSLCVRDYERLRENAALTPTENLVEELRIIKDPGEIALMEASCALNHKVMEALPGRLVPGMTEAEASWEVERLFREGGASALAFPNIVGVGVNAALPHAEPGPARLPEEGLVLVDCGGRLRNYCSDQTRTYWLGGKPSDRFRSTMDLVREAQDRAIAFIRPGVSMAEIYGVARACFEKQGVADRFTHGLGHGIGLETHEPPSLSSLSQDVCRPGMVITVEPGLYWADWGGVRWEYMVLVTENGCRIL